MCTALTDCIGRIRTVIADSWYRVVIAATPLAYYSHTCSKATCCNVSSMAGPWTTLDLVSRASVPCSARMQGCREAPRTRRHSNTRVVHRAAPMLPLMGSFHTSSWTLGGRSHSRRRRPSKLHKTLTHARSDPGRGCKQHAVLYDCAMCPIGGAWQLFATCILQRAATVRGHSSGLPPVYTHLLHFISRWNSSRSAGYLL